MQQFWWPLLLCLSRGLLRIARGPSRLRDLSRPCWSNLLFQLTSVFHRRARALKLEILEVNLP
jgi:hypothetical protein